MIPSLRPELISFMKSGEVLTKPGDAESGLAWLPPVANEEQKKYIAFLIPDYDAVLMPATSDWITARVVALRSHYYLPDMPKAVHKAMLADWIKALAAFPKWAIEEACQAWINEQEDKKPTPAAIRKLAASAIAEVSETRDRLNAVLALEQPQNPLLISLRSVMSQGEIEAWIKPLVVSIDGDTAIVRSPSIFHRDWVREKLDHHIARALSPAVPLYLGPSEKQPKSSASERVSAERLTAMVNDLVERSAVPVFKDEEMSPGEKERRRSTSMEREKRG